MAIDGSLTDVALADICQLLALGRKTGCLTVTNRSNFGYIYFRKGRVIFASVLDHPDRLGDLLVNNEVIGQEDLSKALKEQRNDRSRQLGEILVAQGAVSRDDLEKWVTVQIREAVFHLFTWETGSFHFNPDEAPEEGRAFLVSLNADGLLMEGARRVDEWTQIEKKIHSMDLIFQLVRNPEEEDEVELSPSERRLLPLLDGSRTVDDLVAESGLVEFETGKALYDLLQAGFVQEAGRRTPEGDETGNSGLHRHMSLGQAFYKAGMLEDAAQEFEAALACEPGEVTARFRLGIIALKSGEPARALEHFEAVPSGRSKGYGIIRNRALALEQLGRFQEALEVLEEAERVNADDPGLALARGIAELKSGDARAARATFQNYRERIGSRRPPPIHYAYAVLAAAASGYSGEAVALGREGLQLHPADAALLVNTGAVLDHRGDHEAAEQYFTRALSAGTELPAQAHKNLGDQAFRRGDTSGARTHYENAVRLAPSLGDDVFLKLGKISLKDADRRMAVLLLKRAIELNPGNEEARACLEELSSRS